MTALVSDLRAVVDGDETAPPARIDLEVLVPAFNEERRIEHTIRALLHHLERMPINSVVRVIDNGSSDRTPDIVQDLMQSCGGDRLRISGCARRGKGSAVARGVLSSTAAWVGFCDADLATSLDALDQAVEYLAEGWPVVFGSRHCKGARHLKTQPVLRRAGGRAFQLVTRELADGIFDTQCGFKFFDRTAAQRIFAGTAIAGFAFDLEILARARHLELPVMEFPVAWADQPGSTFHPVRDGIEVALDLWELRKASRELHRDVGVIVP